MNGYLAKLNEIDVLNRRVLVRVDLNVPLKESSNGRTVSDDTRIRGILPTLENLIAREARVILASHLGRPDGKRSSKYSLEPVGAALSELLKRDVILSDDCVGDGPRSLSHQLRSGEVLLLENLRFHPEEEENSQEFAGRLLELCDCFVGDAFGTLHRAHASTSAAPKMAAAKAIGLLVEKELSVLEPLRNNPKQPLTLVMGGAKVSDKIGLLENFLPKVQNVIIGGAMAYAFLKALGKEIGKSLCDDKQVQLASKLLKAATARNIRILLPIDHVIVTDIKNPEEARVTANADIPAGWMGVDIGPKTLDSYAHALNVETIFWNGPVGIFETPAYAKGTFGLAERIANSSAKKIAGGGDCAAAIAASGFESNFDFISTGGGATLEYLEGKSLPGLTALEIPRRGI